MKRAAASLLICFLLAGAFWLGRQSARPSIEAVETVRVDTIYRDRPVLVASTLRPVTISVPRVLFARECVKDSCKSFTDAGGYVKDSRKSFADADTNQVAATDSVAVEIPIETRTYRDSLLTAQVSGPVVGDYHPTLDWYEVYGHTRTITNTVTKRSRFAVTAGAGVAWTPEGIRPTVGVQVGVVLWGW